MTMEIKQVQKVIVICGQTATGKSALAVRIAKKFGGEVISADSRQVYRGLDIGTGKIAKREMAGIPHHLLDIANPQRRFTVAEFQTIAGEKIGEIISRKKVPVICGGTGFYIDSLFNNTDFPQVPPNHKLRKQLEKKNAEELYALLKELDPRRAKTIDARNPRRLVRAIEIALYADRMRTKRRQNAERETRKNVPQYDTLWIGLTLPPEKLKKKISIRLFARISRGMIAEVKKLHAQGISWKRMDKLGLEYRYVSRCHRGLITEREMIEKLKTEIYRYAKRQMTWFKRNKAIKWFSPSEKKKILKTVAEFLK